MPPRTAPTQPKPGRLLTLGAQQPDFKIFSTTLKAAMGDDGKRRISGVASSTVKDLHGDRMSETAMNSMLMAAQNNMTIFLNHSYELPEDLFGSVESASLTSEGDVMKLNFVILVDENERAIKTYDAIERGRKLGISIGGLVLNWSENKDDHSWIIEDIMLLEASIVGIPANQQSWVDQAVKSIVERYVDVEEEGVDHDAIMVKSLQLKEAREQRVAELRKAAGLEVDADPETEDPEPDVEDSIDPQESDEEPDAVQDNAEVTDAPAPSQETPGDVTEEAEEPVTADSDPTVTSAAQEAPQSDPGTAASSEPAEAEIQEAVENALRSGALMGAAADAINHLMKLWDQAKTERDANAADLKLAMEALRDAHVTINRLMDLPVGRKITRAQIATDHSEKLRRLYGDEFMVQMAKTKAVAPMRS